MVGVAVLRFSADMIAKEVANAFFITFIWIGLFTRKGNYLSYEIWASLK